MPRYKSMSPAREVAVFRLPAAGSDSVRVAVTSALSMSLTTISARLSGVSSCRFPPRQIGRRRRVVDRGTGERLAAGDRRCHPVTDAGRDRKVAVEVRRRREVRPASSALTLAIAPEAVHTPVARIISRGHGARGCRVEAAGGRIRQRQGRGHSWRCRHRSRRYRPG